MVTGCQDFSLSVRPGPGVSGTVSRLEVGGRALVSCCAVHLLQRALPGAAASDLLLWADHTSLGPAPRDSLSTAYTPVLDASLRNDSPLRVRPPVPARDIRTHAVPDRA